MVRLALPRGRPEPARLLTASLGAGLGLGLTSCAFFLWLAALGSPGKGFVILEGVAVFGLALAVAVGLSRAPARPAAAPVSLRPRLTGVSAVLWLGLASTLLALALVSSGVPHGRWDAWMTWNLRARFFVRAGDHWRDGFSDLLRHGDYPLLLPASVARGWTYAGAETLVVPAAIGALFTLATVGLLYAGLAALRGRGQGALGALVLLGTSFFVFHGASQYADVPLAFFALGTVVLVSLGEAFPEMAARAFLLAGLWAALGAWTKNEGLVFLAAFLVARSATAAWRGALGMEARRLGAFLAGLAPVLLLVAYFKVAFPVPNDLLSDQGVAATLARLLELERWSAVARAFKSEILDLGHNGLVSAPGLLFVYALCVGPGPGGPERRASVTALLALMLTLGGYALVFLTAPTDVPRLLAASVDRVLLHVWPAAVFCFFLAMGTPEEAGDR